MVCVHKTCDYDTMSPHFRRVLSLFLQHGWYLLLLLPVTCGKRWNEAVTKNTTIPESTLKKKHHSIAYHRCREAVTAGTIRVAKQGT